MARRILVIGSANADLIMRVPRLPRPGESLPGCQFATATGGKGANQAIAAARLGACVAFAGAVGDDAFGREQRRTLEDAGVDCARLRPHPHLPTGTAVILVADDGQNAIAVAPGANAAHTPADIEALEDAIADADLLLVQLEIPLDATRRALELARAHVTFSILDAGPAQPLDRALIALADCVSPNETEAEALTGITVRDFDTARAAAGALLAQGTPRALMKLGAQGCLYLGPEGERTCPAFRVQAVDTVAAGDAFTAAFALLYPDHTLEDTLRFACAAGALATTRPGAAPSLPMRDEVESLLAAQPK